MGCKSAIFFSPFLQTQTHCHRDILTLWEQKHRVSALNYQTPCLPSGSPKGPLHAGRDCGLTDLTLTSVTPIAIRGAAQ